MSDMSRALELLLLGRGCSPEEERVAQAIFALLGERFMAQARRCRSAGLIDESWLFMEAAYMVTEARFDLFGGEQPPSVEGLLARRESREIMLRVIEGS